MIESCIIQNDLDLNLLIPELIIILYLIVRILNYLSIRFFHRLPCFSKISEISDNLRIMCKERKGLWFPILIIGGLYITEVIFLSFFNICAISSAPNLFSLDYLFRGVILSPIAEEIVQCFLLFILLRKISLNQWSLDSVFKDRKNKKYFVYLILLILVSLSFSILHLVSNLSFIMIILTFTIYGILYHSFDRKLSPPILAHTTWNLLVWIIPITFQFKC